MDDKLVSEMVQDLQQAVGYVPIPTYAKQAREWMEESGTKYEATRKALKELVKSGVWKKARRGNRTFYWKVLKDG